MLHMGFSTEPGAGVYKMVWGLEHLPQKRSLGKLALFSVEKAQGRFNQCMKIPDKAQYRKQT